MLLLLWMFWRSTSPSTAWWEWTLGLVAIPLVCLDPWPWPEKKIDSAPER